MENDIDGAQERLNKLMDEDENEDELAKNNAVGVIVEPLKSNLNDNGIVNDNSLDVYTETVIPTNEGEKKRFISKKIFFRSFPSFR